MAAVTVEVAAAVSTLGRVLGVVASRAVAIVAGPTVAGMAVTGVECPAVAAGTAEGVGIPVGIHQARLVLAQAEVGRSRVTGRARALADRGPRELPMGSGTLLVPIAVALAAPLHRRWARARERRRASLSAVVS